MRKDNYENHIRMLNHFKELLKSLRAYIKTIKEKYKYQIDYMEEAGFVENIVEPLRNKYQVFSLKIDDMEELLKTYEEKINKQIEGLNYLREIARRDN